MTRTIEAVRSATSGKPVRLEHVIEDGTAEGHYIMTGPTGTHTLAESETDTKRLAAHWRGFCELNDAVNAEMALAAADPKKVESSRASLKDLQRAEYLIELLRGRIEAETEQARKFQTNWAEAGDSQKLVNDLLNMVTIDGDDKGKLLAEIDVELDQ